MPVSYPWEIYVEYSVFYPIFSRHPSKQRYRKIDGCMHTISSHMSFSNAFWQHPKETYTTTAITKTEMYEHFLEHFTWKSKVFFDWSKNIDDFCSILIYCGFLSYNWSEYWNAMPSKEKSNHFNCPEHQPFKRI